MIPQSLKDSLRAGKVIPFVGAGVSMAVRRKVDGQSLFPSWRDLLLGAAERLEQENKKPDADLVRAYLAIDPPKYLDAAGHARDRLGSTWAEYLKQRLDPEAQEADPETLALARAVWDLGSKLVVTTNYDRVLFWACPEIIKHDLGLWDIQAPAEQASFLREGIPEKPTVWHLHGHIRNAADLILTPDGYNRLYPTGSDLEQRFEAAKATLRHTLASSSLLFVGFSFQDAHFGITLHEVQKLFSGNSSKHFALVRENDLSLLRSQGLPVELITFQGFGEPLLQLMRQLAEVRESTKMTSSAPVAHPTLDIAAANKAIAEPPHSEAASYSPHNRPFFVPFRAKGDRVVGREKALEDVRRQLTQGKPTAIGQTASFEGIGGLGKTQLAVEYAWRYGDTYPNGVIWINADQDIDAQLTRLAVEAKWVAYESEHKVKLDIAKHRLRSYSHCLTIFDNLEDFSAIEPYLPDPGAQPHILATSRTEQPLFTSIDLDLLDIAQAFQLLIQEAERNPAELEEQEAATKIVEHLGRLPLALEMAGAYLRHRRLLTWRQYLGMLESNLRAALRPGLLASFTRHEQDLFATLKIQEDILQDEPLLRSTLDILTWSSPRSIGLSLLGSLLKTDEVLLTSALALGQKLRILEKEEGKNRYSLHRLISRVRREEIPLEQQRDWVEELCVRMGDWFEARRLDFADLPAFEAEIDHLRVWQEHAVKMNSRQISRLIWLEAYPSYHRGLYRKSLKRVFEAISHLQSGEEPRLEAWLWNDLGTTTGLVGDRRKGLEYSQKALSIRLAALGEQHSDTALSLSNMAGAHIAEGEYRKALELESKALEIRRSTLGEQHRDTAQSLGRIGAIYSLLGDDLSALDFRLKALEICNNLFIEQHPDTARILDGVGSSYFDLGDYHKALGFELKALEIKRNVLGEQHPETASSLSSVSVTYASLGDHPKSLDLQLQSLKIRTDLLGEQHPDTADSLERLGNIYSNLKEHQKALEHKLKALEIKQKYLGEQHPRVAATLNTIGSTYYDLGYHQKALELALRALEINRSALGEHHPETAKYLHNAGAAYYRSSNYKKALEFALKALEINLNVLGEQHPNTAEVLHSIGASYFRLGDHRFLEYRQKALEIRRKMLGEQHPDTMKSVVAVTQGLLGKNKRKEAFELLEPYIRALSPDHPAFSELESLRRKVLSKPLRPGFRQPTAQKLKKKKR